MPVPSWHVRLGLESITEITVCPTPCRVPRPWPRGGASQPSTGVGVYTTRVTTWYAVAGLHLARVIRKVSEGVAPIQVDTDVCQWHIWFDHALFGLVDCSTWGPGQAIADKTSKQPQHAKVRTAGP